MPQYKHVSVEDLPAGWEVRFFSDLTDFRTGRTPPRNREEYWQNGLYPWVSIADMVPFGSVFETKERVSELAHQDVFRRAIVPAGSYLMSFKLTIGRVARLAVPAYHNEAIISYIPHVDGVDPEYLFYHLAQINYRDYQDTAIKGQTLNRAKLSALEIALPPKAEQRKIADVLSLVRRAIAQQERLIALTTELKKSLMRKLFTEGLRGEPQKQTEIGLVPQSWEVVKLADVCSFLSGGTPSKLKPEFWSGTIPWVSPKDMKRPRLSDVADHISEAGLKDGSALAPAGAVFVVIRGMILAKDVPVALAEVPMAFNQDMKVVIPGPRIESGFLLYALTAFRPRLSRKVGRSAHGTMTLMSSEITQFLIPLPDKDTQREVVTAIETVECRNELHRARRSALSDLFRTLLHQLMTGQIRVKDLVLPESSDRTQAHRRASRSLRPAGRGTQAEGHAHHPGQSPTRPEGRNEEAD
jgi:type I restriction enzyme S subunit